MKIFYRTKELIDALHGEKSVGFVPTMGALHLGHMSLIRASKSQNTLTVCSIFVNPLQFNNLTDFEKYPKTLSNDILLLESENCDILFAPEYNQIYTQTSATTIDFGYQNTILEGRYRQGHFNGVGIVVSKLFNIVKPNIAYFGQKDFQQCLIIKQLIQDLSFPIRLQIVPTIRENDGLAMSSRNVHLNIDDRKTAANIYKGLQSAQTLATQSTISEIKGNISQDLSAKNIQVEYADILDYETGTLCTTLEIKGKYVLCIAAYIGKVRLIDNIVFNL